MKQSAGSSRNELLRVLFFPKVRENIYFCEEIHQRPQKTFPARLYPPIIRIVAVIKIIRFFLFRVFIIILFNFIPSLITDALMFSVTQLKLFSDVRSHLIHKHQSFIFVG